MFVYNFYFLFTNVFYFQKSRKTVRFSLKGLEDENDDEVLENPDGNCDNAEERELVRLKLEQHDRHQQIEASNRWKELELQTPSHDIGSLNRKYSGVSSFFINFFTLILLFKFFGLLE